MRDQSRISVRALVAVAAAGFVLHAAPARAVLVWNESVNGDLSNDRLNPTLIALGAGANSLIATSQAGDREYVHMTIPAGFQLSSIMLVSWVSVDQIGFSAVQAGSTFTEPPTGTVIGNLLGYTHFGPGAIPPGNDILPSMGTGAGSIGFTPPLAGSNYTFWIQQTSPNPATYQFDYVVTQTPAPGAAALLGLSILAAARRRR